jgi:Penicillin amidase
MAAVNERTLAEVRVGRDSWSVPHIYAPNADDLFFAKAATTKTPHGPPAEERSSHL